MQNRAGFVNMIQENEGLIYKVTRVYANSREDEQDLRQEIIYQLWKSFDSFRNESKITTWMYRIALNTSIAYASKQKKMGNYLPVNEALLNKTEATDNLQEEQLAILYQQIKNLNTIEKGVILLYLEGKSYEEIAAITGFTVSNVGMRLARIKQKIITQIK